MRCDDNTNGRAQVILDFLYQLQHVRLLISECCQVTLVPKLPQCIEVGFYHWFVPVQWHMVQRNHCNFLCYETIATHFQYGRTELIICSDQDDYVHQLRGASWDLFFSEQSKQDITKTGPHQSHQSDPCPTIATRLSQMKVIKNNRSIK